MVRTILVALFAACAAMAGTADDAWNWYENEALPLGGKAFTDTETFFERWPAAAKGKLPGGLVSMGRHTTGMYLRFSTDSDKIRIEWKVRDEHPYDPLIPEAGLIGLDVYGWDSAADGGKGAWRFQGNKRYWPRDKKNPGTAEFGWTPGRPCIVYLPLRATMVSFRIGVAKGKTIKPHPYRVPDAKPIVHYGTSIVHGGCASRPGLANMSPEMVATNCAPFLRKMKELKPDVPILLCEGCTVRDHDSCNPAFRKVYDALKAEDPVKWRNLYYFEEKTMLPKEDQEATHDFCHRTTTACCTWATPTPAASARCSTPRRGRSDAHCGTARRLVK